MGAFRRRRKQADEPPIPTDSMADITFLLIIFFVLATTFTKLTGMKTELPAGEKGGQQQEQTNTVQLNEGTITFNGDKLDVEALRTKLIALKLPEKKDDEKIIVLETSGGVAYQDYYAVMATINAAGGVVAIISEEDEGGK